MATVRKRTDSLREYQRNWAANRRAKMTPKEREEYKAKNRQRRASRTPQEKELSRQYNRAYFSSLSPEKRKQYADSSSCRTPIQKQNRRQYMRARNLQLKYGMTPGEWDAMFSAQGNTCAICKSPNPRNKLGWATDHCHDTGKTRGILCHFCNVLLGQAQDDEQVLFEAASYLMRHREE